MTNQQLIDFIKKQLKLNVPKDKITEELLANGWNNQDITEGFTASGASDSSSVPIIPKEIIPNSSTPRDKYVEQKIAQSEAIHAAQPIIQEQTPIIEKGEIKKKGHLSRNIFFILLTLLILAGGAAAYYFKDEIVKLPIISDFFPAEETLAPETVVPDVVAPEATEGDATQAEQDKILSEDKVIDCGIVEAFEPPQEVSEQEKYTYDYTQNKNKVLECLGNSVINCSNAKGILNYKTTSKLPTIFEVINDNSSCYFKLSYDQNKNIDITGNDRAGQFLECPINEVKAIDVLKSSYSDEDKIFFMPLDKNNLVEYAEGIYDYGMSVLFEEADFDQSKIEKLGCSGDMIKSVINQFKTIQAKITLGMIKDPVSYTRADAEIYFNKNGSYKDVCKTAFTKSIESNTRMTYVCFDSEKSYAFSASLNTGNFYCADSYGSVVEIKKQITGPKCQ